MTQTIIWTVAILSVLGLLLALILFWVARKFRVEEDPRIDAVEEAEATAAAAALPGVTPSPMRPSRRPTWTPSTAP